MTYRDPDDERNYQRIYHLLHRGADAAKRRGQLAAAKGTWEDLLEESRLKVKAEREKAYCARNCDRRNARLRAYRAAIRDTINATQRAKYADDTEYRERRKAQSQDRNARKRLKATGGAS